MTTHLKKLPLLRRNGLTVVINYADRQCGPMRIALVLPSPPLAGFPLRVSLLFGLGALIDFPYLRPWR